MLTMNTMTQMVASVSVVRRRRVSGLASCPVSGFSSVRAAQYLNTPYTTRPTTSRTKVTQLGTRTTYKEGGGGGRVSTIYMYSEESLGFFSIVSMDSTYCPCPTGDIV